ncbi:DUF1715-domain-containing protein [Daldinia caldariorum]|uniref:DUF1715-domain-containing protein n=1 Tax=Daldinia caldariorum TaxID=326644 RepID=UPI002008065C|nr:DUF1715-domain-containing protein [Daldinia caldariorum]KAI1466089.1 DUF1715-domain-containing protein [Daldinia caldariorum]
MDDLFDDILNLEEQYYKQGYDEGYRDGAEAGRVEGRSVGMKTGFEKFLEAGRLQGRAIVWQSRLPNRQKSSSSTATASININNNSQQKEETAQEGQQSATTSQDEKEKEDSEQRRLPPLSSNPRLEKNITMLYGILEPGTLSTQNDDESVNDFDSRLKGAQSRVKMIERAIGEGAGDKGSANRNRQPGQKNENIEDIGRIPQRTDAVMGTV